MNRRGPVVPEVADTRYMSDSGRADKGDTLWRLPAEEVVAFTLEHLRRMFPDLTDDWILAAHVWRARYAQPVVERGYRRLIPDMRTPVTNLFLATMAQIYPEDRGTNHAIRQGREVARAVAVALNGAG